MEVNKAVEEKFSKPFKLLVKFRKLDEEEVKKANSLVEIFGPAIVDKALNLKKCRNEELIKFLSNLMVMFKKFEKGMESVGSTYEDTKTIFLKLMDSALYLKDLMKGLSKFPNAYGKAKKWGKEELLFESMEKLGLNEGIKHFYEVLRSEKENYEEYKKRKKSLLKEFEDSTMRKLKEIVMKVFPFEGDEIFKYVKKVHSIKELKVYLPDVETGRERVKDLLFDKAYDVFDEFLAAKLSKEEFFEEFGLPYSIAEKAGIVRRLILDMMRNDFNPKELISSFKSAADSPLLTSKEKDMVSNFVERIEKDASFFTQFKEIYKATKKEYFSWLREHNSKIFEKFVLVHLTDVFPEEGVVKPYLYTDKPLALRSTIHFCLNGPVSSHMYGSWASKSFAIIVPMEKVKHWVSRIQVVDTYGFHTLKLPEGSKILVSEKKYFKMNLSKLKPGNASIITYNEDSLRGTVYSNGRAFMSDKRQVMQWLWKLIDKEKGKEVDTSDIPDWFEETVKQRFPDYVEKLGVNEEGLKLLTREYIKRSYGYELPEDFEWSVFESPLHMAVYINIVKEGYVPLIIGMWGSNLGQSNENVLLTIFEAFGYVRGHHTGTFESSFVESFGSFSELSPDEIAEEGIFKLMPKIIRTLNIDSVKNAFNKEIENFNVEINKKGAKRAARMNATTFIKALSFAREKNPEFKKLLEDASSGKGDKLFNYKLKEFYKVLREYIVKTDNKDLLEYADRKILLSKILNS